MSRLTAVQELRLYESLGTIAEALPDDYRREFYRVIRYRVLWNYETSEAIRRRALVRKHLPDLVMDDWRWVLGAVPNPGADDVLRRWANDAGLTRAPIEIRTAGKGSDRGDAG